jgi:acetylornithine aminotransferase
MILDEIQPVWRTGKLFGFQNCDIVPDVVVMGKEMGGGVPVGATTATAMMDLLSDNQNWGILPLWWSPCRQPVLAGNY